MVVVVHIHVCGEGGRCCPERTDLWPPPPPPPPPPPLHGKEEEGEGGLLRTQVKRRREGDWLDHAGRSLNSLSVHRTEGEAERFRVFPPAFTRRRRRRRADNVRERIRNNIRFIPIAVKRKIVGNEGFNVSLR